MRRREFLGVLGGAAVWPLAARAQQGAMPVVGYLNLASANRSAERIDLFRQGLNESGFVEGRNVTVEYRWAQGQYDRLGDLTADLIRRRVAVIAATSGAAVRAVKAATTSIPIVFYIGEDPVAAGFVPSLNRPGGNITGVYNWSQALEQKRLQLLRELVPTATTIGHLVNPNNAANAERQSQDAQTAASQLGLQIHRLNANSENDLEAVFETLKSMRASGLLIGGDLFFANQSERLAALAERHVIPAISEYRQFAKAGGLATYGVRLATDMYRLLGVYTGRILKGEKPPDLPVQQATTVELVINLKTAKALGITVPLPLLGRADEVIE